jgi:hypothetical protein
MPTILYIRGWRIFFYANEGHEPCHVHTRKAGAEGKFWLDPDLYEIHEAWSVGFSPRLRREIRKILYDHFELILEAWDRFIEEHRHGKD